jgi:hypothetical protein
VPLPPERISPLSGSIAAGAYRERAFAAVAASEESRPEGEDLLVETAGV